jgi:hypothetical protein
MPEPERVSLTDLMWPPRPDRIIAELIGPVRVPPARAKPGGLLAYLLFLPAQELCKKLGCICCLAVVVGVMVLVFPNGAPRPGVEPLTTRLDGPDEKAVAAVIAGFFTWFVNDILDSVFAAAEADVAKAESAVKADMNTVESAAAADVNSVASAAESDANAAESVAGRRLMAGDFSNEGFAETLVEIAGRKLLSWWSVE